MTAEELDKVVWKCCATVVSFFVLTVGACNMHYHHEGYKAATEMVKAGAHPVAARCAVWDGLNSAVCLEALK